VSPLNYFFSFVPLLALNPGDATGNEDKRYKVSECISRVSNYTSCLTHESFQAITCTGIDNRQQSRKYTKNTKKQTQNKQTSPRWEKHTKNQTKCLNLNQQALVNLMIFPLILRIITTAQMTSIGGEAESL